MKLGKIILDTNLSVLLVVGSTDRNLIARHKRLQAYDATDYDLLAHLLRSADGLRLSPNILTETSNLASQIEAKTRNRVMATFGQFIDMIQEEYVPSRSAARRSEFVRLGLADSAILQMASPETTIVTADILLYLAAAQSGLSVINFNHMRDQRKDFQP